MNVMPDHSAFAGASPLPAGDVQIEVEQAILGRCLVRPDQFATVADRVRADDFADPVHARLFAVLVALAAEGRSPSIEAVTAVMGDDELAGGVTLRSYLRRLAKEAVVGAMMPLDGAIETLRDACMRRRLTSAGSLMASMAAGGRPVADIVADVVAELDDVAASVRQGKALVYDGAGAVDAALAHIGGSDGSYPTTGLADLDRYLGGWPRGQLSILAGRPGMGKSAAAASALVRAARKGFASMFFSLEMTQQQLGARLAADLAYTASNPIYYEDILQRRVDERQIGRIQQAREIVAGFPLRVEEQRGLTMSEIVARARKHAATLDRDGQRLEAVFVDHIGLVRPSNRYAGNRVREMAEISDGLATLAKELDCSVIGLCQLNRGVEGRDNKRPSLADLRDSGAIEEDASTVTFVFRPAYYLEKSREDDPQRERERLDALAACRHELEFVVAKNRNGRCGVVRAFCDIGANAIRDAKYS